MAITINGSANTVAGLAVGGLPDGVVDNDTLANTTITAAKIAADTITASQIAADTITASQIAANAVGDSELNAVTGKVLQVVTATNATNVAVTGSTYTTFITKDITPVAQSSKFIVIICTGIYMSETGSQNHYGCGWTMSRNIGGSSVTGLIGDPQDSSGPYGHFYYTSPDGQHASISTKIGYDSPNTTSTVTYFGEGRPYYGTGNSATFGATSDSQIVIYEVAA